MKKPSAPCAMLLDWPPRVTLNELAVSARNAETLAKLNAHDPSRKLLLRNCRYSTPIFTESRPQAQVQVSLTTNVMSPRPAGYPEGPPKLRAPPAMFIWGRPIAWLMPSRMPKSAGFKRALFWVELD